MDWATGVPQNPSIRAQSVVISRTHFCNQHIYHPSPLLPQNRRGINPILRALPWSLPAVRRQICMCTQPPSDPQGDEDESFWEKPEGKQIIAEIEDMKELISEAKKLKNEEEQASGGSTDLSQEIAKKAKEQAERRKQAEKMFQLGQRAYGRGSYDKSVEFLEAALTNIPGDSLLGGEVQIWLAMAYDANGRYKDCITLYKKLEATHTSMSIRRQAKDLRYIVEAPKLKISKEEMVSIPLLDDTNARTWSKMYKERRPKPLKKTAPSKDYLDDWLVWEPPRWERSPYFWVALTVWLTLIGISLVFQD